MGVIIRVKSYYGIEYKHCPCESKEAAIKLLKELGFQKYGKVYTLRDKRLEASLLPAYTLKDLV